jgi:hypothetical protein
MTTDTLLHDLETALLSEGFVQAHLNGAQVGAVLPYRKITVRPVLLKGVRHLQVSSFDEKKDITKNYAGEEAIAKARELLAMPFRNWHVQTQTETWQVQFSKKGKPIVSHKTHAAPVAVDLAHDRAKAHILPEGADIPFLHAIGITTPEGRVKADMRHKFHQINEFLRLLSDVVGTLKTVQGPIEVVDFGCGSAHLSFAAYYYLTEIRKRDAHVVGVDLKADLMARNTATARSLGWHMDFVTGTIADYVPQTPPHLVIALHACDTATDDALAQAMLWESPLVLAAPCCHHHLHEQLSQQTTPAPFTPLLRYGIFHERFADLLTDTFRTLLLRQAGYRVDVVEFVDAEHTPRNVMLRAVKLPGQPVREAAAEYAQLQDYWHVTPYLESALREKTPTLFG